MEKGRAPEDLSVTKPLQKPFQSSFTLLPIKRKQLPSLVSLCLGVIGRHFEDIIEDLAEIASNFPPNIKMALTAIARRRKLLNDDVIMALAESSWEILDISGSDVSDVGLLEVVKTCKYLKAVDVSRCSKVTSAGVSELLQHCQSLEILRWGGCPRSEHTARGCLSMLKPNLKDVEGESWEEVDASEIAHGAQSLRWLVWPKIEKHLLENLQVECPRIIVNPKTSPLGFRGLEVPREATLDVALDDPIVEDIDPKMWAVSGIIRTTLPSASRPPDELSIAEKFRLAFEERDTRLAPKRAKNARQRQRRAEREWVMMSTKAKALALASQATKSLHIRN
nr:protein AMN1 homolog [Ipomoea batatas]